MIPARNHDGPVITTVITTTADPDSSLLLEEPNPIDPWNYPGFLFQKTISESSDPAMPVSPSPRFNIARQAPVLDYLNGEYLCRLEKVCSFFGCNTVAFSGTRYCCANTELCRDSDSSCHSWMATTLGLGQEAAYVLVDSCRDQDIRCTLALLNHCNKIEVGLPTITDQSIFNKVPWEWDFIHLDHFPFETQRAWAFFHATTTPKFEMFDYNGAILQWRRKQPQRSVFYHGSEIVISVSHLCEGVVSNTDLVSPWTNGWTLREYLYLEGNSSVFVLSCGFVKKKPSPRLPDVQASSSSVNASATATEPMTNGQASVFPEEPTTDPAMPTDAVSLLPFSIPRQPPVLYYTNGHYIRREDYGCSFFGCNHLQVIPYGMLLYRYCCLDHLVISRTLATCKKAYVVVDSFLDQALRCCLALRKYCAGFPVGIPTITDKTFFSKVPWEWDFIDLDFFTDESQRAWIFFHCLKGPVCQVFNYHGVPLSWHKRVATKTLSEFSVSVFYLYDKDANLNELVVPWIEGWILTRYRLLEQKESIFVLSWESTSAVKKNPKRRMRKIKGVSNFA